MIKEVVKFYKGYLDRHDTYEEFARDVNTLGGTFICEGQTLKNSNWIKTEKNVCIIQDKNWEIITKIKLLDVWKEYKTPQLTLF